MIAKRREGTHNLWVHLRFFSLVALGYLLVVNDIRAAQQTNVVMLLPGFVVKALPIKLSNANNIRFTPDGKLTVLGYDGRIHILSDSDGDGLEDSDKIFWDKQTLSVPVGMTWSKEGLYVSSHGKISLLRDTDGDGVADEEKIIAEGWTPTDVASGGVDATAITEDKDGNLYFGLLVADYSNPYRVKDGISHYDLQGKRGTIQKWIKSTGKLETIATGIRVPYSLAFNKFGDLFNTDQEGETWCPNGNPLDELNQIIPGRNYGFPPRHPDYLPSLVSEAPVVGFGPQHQSTCGLVFNEPSPTQKLFGPPGWEGDAFIAGESRGKIWRVRMVRTPHGYVGKETLIARLDMLATDVAISPKGALYVSAHSGQPDWGTGPRGDGKIFQIQYLGAEIHPVAAWAPDSMEVKVAFDGILNPSVTNNPDAIKVEFGAYVAAADRMEKLKPPYAAVKNQEITPRGKLHVIAAHLEDNGRTLTLLTDPHPQAVRYAITIPNVISRGTSSVVDMVYDLGGVEAKWFSVEKKSTPAWSGWLPHLDIEISRSFTQGSASHESLFAILKQKGVLELVTDLYLPKGNYKVSFESNAGIDVLLHNNQKSTGGAASSGASFQSSFQFESVGAPVKVIVKLVTGGASVPVLHAFYQAADEPYSHALGFEQLLQTWAPRPIVLPALVTEKKELDGGDFERGRSLFFGEAIRCSTCHAIRGDGANVGPDLSNLADRDPASVLRDIQFPDVSIHPDYVAYNVSLKNGDDVTGFVQAQSPEIVRVVGADGKSISIARTNVISMRPSSVSLMPTGLTQGLNDLQIRDLLTFLCSKPPLRTEAEIQSVKSKSRSTSKTLKRLKIVLVDSKQDHGQGQHDYPAWKKSWGTIFKRAEAVDIGEAWEWPTQEQWDSADVVIAYFWNHKWDAGQYAQLDAFQKRGGGMVILHSATIADEDAESLSRRIGMASHPKNSKYRHMLLTLDFPTNSINPIIQGFKNLQLVDEPYWPLVSANENVEVLATARVDGSPQPLIWTFKKGDGRVFSCIPTHYTWSLEDPLYRILLFRGVAWAAKEDVGRFEDLK